MNTLNTPEDLDITATTAKGNTYKVSVYVDPYPGRKGSERVWETCTKCGGDGVVHWGNVHFVAQGRDDRHCFGCMGSGKTSRLVSSARSTARRIVKAANQWAADAADAAAEAPARLAAEIEKAHTEALEIEAARNAKPKGHLGAEGERLRNLTATVTLVHYYESVGRYGQPEARCIIKFDVDGKTAVWFTGYANGLEEGQQISLTGTVKSRGDRDGEDQTILSRCTWK